MTKRPRENEHEGAQEIIEKGEQKIIRNSPYGLDRLKLGWGTPFAPCCSCLIENLPNVHIGLSSLNGVPSKKREMEVLMQLYMKKYNILEHCAPYHKVNERIHWERWYDLPGKKEFMFTVKANSYLTHERQLELDDETAAHIDLFFKNRCAALKQRLAAVLLQMPPSFKCTAIHMERIEAVASQIPSDISIAVEFRHHSWFCENVYALLRKVRWTLVTTHNDETGQSPVVDTGTDLMYVRLHGALAAYVGDYGAQVMKTWADEVLKFVMKDKKRKVFFFMNNNESSIQGLTSSNVDATFLAQCLRDRTNVKPLPVEKKEAPTDDDVQIIE